MTIGIQSLKPLPITPHTARRIFCWPSPQALLQQPAPRMENPAANAVVPRKPLRFIWKLI